jgi:HK97 family phage prohead protease
MNEPTLGPIEYRSATTLEIRHAQRMIDMIAVPYNEPTQVLRRGRLVTEEFDPLAFNGVDGDVTVNRAHDLEHPLGRVTSFHPNDPRGLRVELRISKTSGGDEVLELADDGLLAPSVGFAALPGGEQWTADRRSVRVTRAKLFHIGLTGDPAYKGAKVLAVRSDHEPVERVSTPNLDRLRLEMLVERARLT